MDDGSSSVSLSMIAEKSYEIHFSSIYSTLSSDVTRRQSELTGCNLLVKFDWYNKTLLNILTRPESLKDSETLRFIIKCFYF